MREWGFPAVAATLAAIAQINGQAARPDRGLYQVLGPSISDVTVLDEGFGNQVVRGKPFTALEERHSLQILRDGTRIENDRKDRLFRDSQGRTRVEETNGTATIFDLVAGFRAELDPSSKTARKGSAALAFAVLGNLLKSQPNPGTTKGVMSETTENLKPQLVSGIMAQGVRTTMIIPKGQIGNSREIKVVTERWVSSDLQMLIKSTNSDPRFGDTTYLLTAIDQREPDASLFQIPSTYTVVNIDGGRGGRSPIPGGRSGGPGGRSGTPQQVLDDFNNVLKDKK
jgi:hypothetical protein